MPASASVSASSATGSAYTPLPHVHSRSWSTRWTKFSIPANGNCTHRASGASSNAAIRAAGFRGSAQTIASASAKPTR